MRKIERGVLAATQFEVALAKEIAEHEDGYHPPYSEGAFRDKHYLSVFFALLQSQKGVCAYTESILSINDLLLIPENSFEEGKIKSGIQRKGIDADIEHYDPVLKKDYGWQVSNLFLCRVFINRDMKKDQPTLPELKPDGEAYCPWDYFRYNYKTHRFVPNPEIQDAGKLKAIAHQLDNVLGMNAETIISERATFLTTFENYISLGLKTYEGIREEGLRQFFTAFAMSEAQLKGE